MSKSEGPAPSRLVDDLIALAQRSLTGDPPKRNAASFGQVEQALAQKGRQQLKGRVWAATCAAVLVGVTFFVLLPSSRTEALKFEVLNGVLARSGHVDGTPRGTMLRFSDGTELSLDADARAQVAAVSPHGAEVALERGRVKVHVVSRPGSSWSIRAGEYVVSVTGTSFEVDFDPERRWLTVDLSEGSVAVSGPLIETGLRVSAGQRMLVRPEDALVLVQRRESDSSEPGALAPPAEAGGGVAALGVPDMDAGTRGRAPARKVAKVVPKDGETWSEKVAAGRFEEVIALAERRGAARVYEQGSFRDLHALADAARYVKRADVARPALLAIRSRFPDSLAARDAAFFLGRIEEAEGRASRALEWYDRYLGARPDGVYASQALGRKLLIVHAARGPEAALPVARQYLQLFPQGPYARAAKDLSASR